MTEPQLEKIIELTDKLTEVNGHNKRLTAKVEAMQITINKQRVDMESMQEQLKVRKK